MANQIEMLLTRGGQTWRFRAERDWNCGLTPPGFFEEVCQLPEARKREMRRAILNEVQSITPWWAIIDRLVFGWFFLKEVLTPN
jgi:hypothetical protein